MPERSATSGEVDTETQEESRSRPLRTVLEALEAFCVNTTASELSQDRNSRSIITIYGHAALDSAPLALSLSQTRDLLLPYMDT